MCSIQWCDTGTEGVHFMCSIQWCDTGTEGVHFMCSIQWCDTGTEGYTSCAVCNSVMYSKVVLHSCCMPVC